MIFVKTFIFYKSRESKVTCIHHSWQFQDVGELAAYLLMKRIIVLSSKILI